MGKDMFIHFTRSFYFSRKDILYIDNKPSSKCSEYISEHISEIKALCESYGYSFVFFNDYANQITNDMTEEQRRYYFPSTKGIQASRTWVDYMMQYVTDDDKPLIQPAIFRFNNRCDQVKAQLLQSDGDLMEQFKTYLEIVTSNDQARMRKQMEDDIIEYSIGPSKSRYDGPLFSITVDRAKPDVNDTADRNFSWEQMKMVQEIRERVEKLRLEGIKEEILLDLIRQDVPLSRLVITADFRILLPDYDDMEIEMSPLPKAVFLLFLRHEEGILFKYLVDYREELQQIYTQLTDRVSASVIGKSLDAVCDPTQNAINEKCARIREAFICRFNERLACNYYITGKRGEPKGITLPRNLVEWKCVLK